MGGGEPQAAAVRTAEGNALRALQLGWGAFYMIGHDDERGWWAARRGRVGKLIRADTPEELRAAMAEDYRAAER